MFYENYLKFESIIFYLFSDNQAMNPSQNKSNWQNFCKNLTILSDFEAPLFNNSNIDIYLTKCVNFMKNNLIFYEIPRDCD